MRFQSILACLIATSSLAFADGDKHPAKSANNLEEGRKIFEINCVACHGAAGKGDGAAAAALNPKPRDFTDVAYMKSRPKETIRKVITEGGQSVGLSPVMVGWKGTLNEEQIEAVMNYVLSYSKVKKGKKSK